MLETIIKGGPVMVPIIACSIFALAVILERLWFFWRTRPDGADVITEMRDAVQRGKNMEAMQIARNHSGSTAAVLAVGAAYADINSADVQTHLQQAARAEVFRMEKGMPLLGTVVTITPMLGLLGTVTGIIRSFRVLSALQGLEGPGALSVGISEALITTAAGLIVAIPVLAFYEWFNAIIERRVQDMNKQGDRFVDIVSDARGEA